LQGAPHYELDSTYIYPAHGADRRILRCVEHDAGFRTHCRSRSFSAASACADFGKGKKVVILGGGIAGLVSAYELRKAGFECTILEAHNRPGGRNWTIREGTKVEFIDGTVQNCELL
jgi:NADPH-dependent 2,4-dienoyl-CoA reductase/sulfur reductase-like enzyme